MTIRLREASRLCLPAILLALFGCGPGRNEFAPTCPVARLVPALADLTRYASSSPGPGHDLTDLILQARIVNVDGSCSPSDEEGKLATTVKISIAIQRGPAMHARQADVPVFVAVAEGETVRDKQVFPVHVVFPPNVDRLTMTSPPIDMGLPISQSVSGAAYRIISGFQLTPDELAANRHAGGG